MIQAPGFSILKWHVWWANKQFFWCWNQLMWAMWSKWIFLNLNVKISCIYCCYISFIHSYSKTFILSRIMVYWSLSQVPSDEGGVWPDMSPVHHRTDINRQKNHSLSHSHLVNLDWPINLLKCMTVWEETRILIQNSCLHEENMQTPQKKVYALNKSNSLSCKHKIYLKPFHTSISEVKFCILFANVTYCNTLPIIWYK